ncbi:MAG TPA: GNAT family N-acetyltransferase [Ktedonobacterales bacterium]|nr:GNAT family N-acetyltransferase [Ktedonobacterales bacterium]
MDTDEDKAEPEMFKFERPFHRMDATERPFNPVDAVRDARSVRLADGASVRLRAVNSGGWDDDAFQRMFYSLSDTTRYLYFCAGIPATPLWAERFGSLSRTDGKRSYVLVAEVGDELVGFARFSQGPHAEPQESAADMGILLTDSWQGRRLGGYMLCRLATEALARGLTTLTAVTMWENRRMLRLARRIFPDVRIAFASGTCELTIDLEAWWATQNERMCG